MPTCRRRCACVAVQCAAPAPPARRPACNAPPRSPPLRWQLLSSPQTRALVEGLHEMASFLSGVLVPGAMHAPPAGDWGMGGGAAVCC